MPSLTVFVISAGRNPNLPATIAAVHQQGGDFILERIVDVAPMSAAFQQMLDRCTTPYFVQVDEDMVLDDGAIPVMLETIKGTGENVAMVAFRLHDCHLRKDIYGVKIYKADIFKRYPFDLSHPSCEMEQLERMKADGYGHATDHRVLGKHAPEWTTHGIFERCLNLMEKFKIYKYHWLEGLPQTLWQRLQEEPNEQNLYALFGAFTSLVSEKPLLTGEKNWTHRYREEAILDSWLHGPYYGTLYLTDKCNFRCRFCRRSSPHGCQSAPDMPLQVVGDMLNQFPSIKSMCLCGFGEPLLHENLLPIFQFLHQRGLTVGLITNGSLLKSVMVPSYLNWEAKLHYVSVSLNTHRPDEHREMAGIDVWQDVLDGIKMVQDKGVPVYVSRVCTTENMRDVPEFLEFAHGIGIGTVYLHNLLPYCEEIAGKPFLDLVLQCNRDEYSVERVRQSEHAGIVATYPVLIDPDANPQWCEHPYRFVGVDGAGRVTLCNSVDAPRDDVRIGEAIWHSDYAEGLRGRVRACGGPCKHCFRNWMVP